MSGKVDIFGVKFDNMTIEEIAGRLTEKIMAEDDRPLTVFTPNPEIVMSAREDKELLTVLQSAGITCADGVGIVWASKYFGKRIKLRASGYDVVQELFRISESIGGITAFFYGGSQQAVSDAAIKMSKKYSGLSVIGINNGYDNASDIIDTINGANPSLLLVGLGSPKQEMWVYENAHKLKAKVIMVVGGSFDVMSGNLKRAPVIFRRLGLEWLYRLIKQPKRLFRMLKLPLFVFAVLFERRKRK